MQILLSSWEMLLASAPYMLLGFAAAGLLKALMPDSLVARHLGGTSISGIFKASLLGIPIPI